MMKTNPFSNFNLLLKSGMIVSFSELEDEKTDDVVFDYSNDIYSSCGLYLEYNLPKFSTNKTSYPYTQEGCKEFIRTAATFENANFGTLKFLSLPDKYDVNVHYSDYDNCYYSHIIYCTGSISYVTAVYFRSSDGKVIDDITAQVMSAEYPYGNFAVGISLSTSRCDARESFGIMSLFMSLEKTLTGNLLFDESTVVPGASHDMVFVMPAVYEGTNYTAKVSKELYGSASEHSDDPAYALEFDSVDLFKVYTYKVKLK